MTKNQKTALLQTFLSFLFVVGLLGYLFLTIILSVKYDSGIPLAVGFGFPLTAIFFYFGYICFMFDLEFEDSQQKAKEEFLMSAKENVKKLDFPQQVALNETFKKSLRKKPKRNRK